jgi:hypothetical protein
MHVPQWLHRLRPAFATRRQRRHADQALGYDAALPLGALALVVGSAGADMGGPPDYLPSDAGSFSVSDGF